ncbi:MAG: ROK family protein [Pseudomonadota bacterium]
MTTASATGRPRLWAGIDIGATKIHIVVADGQGQILGRARKKTRSERGVDAVLERVERCLDEACDLASVSRPALAGVGLGAPSPVAADGTVVNAPNMGWRKLPLARILRARWHQPVCVENDCNLGTLGEYEFGAGRGATTLVGLFVGTGLGGGVIDRHEMMRGHNRMAAEVGHMVVEAHGRRCGCGRVGCLEAYASKAGIAGRLRELQISPEPTPLLDDLDPDELSSLNSSVIARAYRAGDAAMRIAVDEAAWYLGVGVASLIALLGPDHIVVGGGVVEALGDSYLAKVRASARVATFPAEAFAGVHIVRSQLGDDAVALGAVAHARRELGTGAPPARRRKTRTAAGS